MLLASSHICLLPSSTSAPLLQMLAEFSYFCYYRKPQGEFLIEFPHLSILVPSSPNISSFFSLILVVISVFLHAPLSLGVHLSLYWKPKLISLMNWSKKDWNGSWGGQERRIIKNGYKWTNAMGSFPWKRRGQLREADKIQQNKRAHTWGTPGVEAFGRLQMFCLVGSIDPSWLKNRERSPFVKEYKICALSITMLSSVLLGQFVILGTMISSWAACESESTQVESGL